MSLEIFSRNMIGSRTLLRTNRVKSARIIELAIWYLATVDDPVSAPPTASQLKKQVRQVYGQIYTIDPLTLFILGIIINMVIKLIIEWWYHRDDVSLKAMQMECTSLKRLMAEKGIK